jgi:hypothetical protein
MSKRSSSFISKDVRTCINKIAASPRVQGQRKSFLLELDNSAVQFKTYDTKNYNKAKNILNLSNYKYGNSVAVSAKKSEPSTPLN